MSVNRVILLGRVGKDPEVKTLEGGNKVVNFTLATSETYKDKNGDKKELTEWHNIIFWGSVSDVIEKYVKKGSQLFIEGKIKTRSWDDKDGNKRYATDIVGSNFSFAGGSSGSSKDENPKYETPVDNKEEEESLPF